MAAVPYIGSKISLISKSDLRYEGTLFTIDPANSTVSLSNVVCFGSEDRLPEVTPGLDTVYPFLIFKGADIKNLYVIEDIDTAAQSQSAPPNDPAIVGTSAPAQSPNAAVIAAAKAKSDAEKADKLLAKQMSKTSISGHVEPPPSHPAGFTPRQIPASQFGYGYQPQGMFYTPPGPYNPAFSGMYAPPPMPYYSKNTAPTDFRQSPASNASQADYRQHSSGLQFPPPPPSQSQSRPAQSLNRNQPTSSESESASRPTSQSRPAQSLNRNQPTSNESEFALRPTTQSRPAQSLNRNQPTSSESESAPRPTSLQATAKATTVMSGYDGYSGPGTARYLESRRFKSAVVKGANSSLKIDESSIDTEFDFQSSNSRFDKESYIRDQASPRDDQDSVNPEPADSEIPSPKIVNPLLRKYDKSSSFFDDISLDRDERGRRENRRGQNEETFGTIAAGYTASNYRRNFNRNRRGRPSNPSRRNNASDGVAAAPQSPIRRTGQQSPRSRGSPRNGSKGRRRGGRRGQSGTPPEQESRPRTGNGKRFTRQPASDSNTPSV